MDFNRNKASPHISTTQNESVLYFSLIIYIKHIDGSLLPNLLNMPLTSISPTYSHYLIVSLRISISVLLDFYKMKLPSKAQRQALLLFLCLTILILTFYLYFTKSLKFIHFIFLSRILIFFLEFKRSFYISIFLFELPS